jgi:hypothetical protein
MAKQILEIPERKTNNHTGRGHRMPNRIGSRKIANNLEKCKGNGNEDK